MCAVESHQSLHSLLGDPCHILTVRVFSQERTRTNNNINTIHTSLHSESSIIHVTSDMGQDLGLFKTEGTDGLAVVEGFGESGGRGELDVFNTEGVEANGDREEHSENESTAGRRSDNR